MMYRGTRYKEQIKCGWAGCYYIKGGWNGYTWLAGEIEYHRYFQINPYFTPPCLSFLTHPFLSSTSSFLPPSCTTSFLHVRYGKSFLHLTTWGNVNYVYLSATLLSLSTFLMLCTVKFYRRCHTEGKIGRAHV